MKKLLCILLLARITNTIPSDKKNNNLPLEIGDDSESDKHPAGFNHRYLTKRQLAEALFGTASETKKSHQYQPRQRMTIKNKNMAHGHNRNNRKR